MGWSLEPLPLAQPPLSLARCCFWPLPCLAKKRSASFIGPLRRWVSSACTYLKGLENPVALRYLSEQRMCAIKLLLYLALGAAGTLRASQRERRKRQVGQRQPENRPEDGKMKRSEEKDGGKRRRRRSEHLHYNLVLILIVICLTMMYVD